MGTQTLAQIIEEAIREGEYNCMMYGAKGSPNGQEVLDALAAAGYAVIPAKVVNGTIKSFRDVEELQLYDAATHGWIDLLAEVSLPIETPTSKEQK